jgi:hypothetical protein
MYYGIVKNGQFGKSVYCLLEAVLHTVFLSRRYECEGCMRQVKVFILNPVKCRSEIKSQLKTEPARQ